MAKNENTTISIVAALGNPGAEYQRTRHNIAWQMIEKLSFYDQLNWQEKFNGTFSLYRFGDEVVFFIKPLVFMNRSGMSIASLMNFYKLKPEEVLVIHDDLELEFGTVSFKRGGGLGGHNGLRSTTSSLGTQDFNRFRLGISRPTHKDITSYVLGPFSKEEQIVLPTYLEEAAKLLEICLTEGFDQVEKTVKKKALLSFE